MLTTILREDGKKNVLGKITGSKASFILPDGKEIEVLRKGRTSIIEQKDLIKRALKVNTDCIVAEIMSIHPENHYIETHRILKPHLVAITNVRKDHIDAMGSAYNKIMDVFSLDIYKFAKVFIHEKEREPVLLSEVKKKGAIFMDVKEGASIPIQNSIPEIKRREFTENIDLVLAICKHLGINQQTIIKGLKKVKYDSGAFKIWQYRPDRIQKKYYFVNGFAANDPESTFKVISKVKNILPFASDKITGLLSLRSDRGDRTIQWIEALKKGGMNLFKGIYVTGAHSRIVKRKLGKINVITNSSPERIMEILIGEIENSSVIFGFGNIKGTGKRLVNYWNQIGEEYGV